MKDFKPRPRARPTHIGNTLVGIFIGLLLGLLIASAIAVYMMKSPLPWVSRPRPAERAEKSDRGTEKGAEKASPGQAEAAKPAAATKSGERPTFDFYRILPGQEGGGPPPAQPKGAAPPGESTAAARDGMMIQAGSFQNPADADNVKAKLALLGLEANIETVDLPDKGTWYRVRLGPYKSPADAEKVRSQLASSGIQSTVVRNNAAP